MGLLIWFTCYLGVLVAVVSSAPQSDRPTSAPIINPVPVHLLNTTCTTDDNRSGIWNYVSNCDQVTFLERIDREITLKIIGHHKNMVVICCVSRTELVSISKKNSIISRVEGDREPSRGRGYCLDIDDHIVDGTKAKVGEYRHMAALGYYDGEKNKFAFNCGGTLISDKFVLTAAHCTAKRIDTPAFVRLGRTSLNLTDTNDPGKVLDIFVKSVFLPNEYNALTKINDIALLELETPIVFDKEMCKNVKPARLWEDVLTGHEEKLIVIGFGTLGTEKQKSNWLMEATVREMNMTECSKKLGFQATLTVDSHLCCYDPVKNQDACQGDSGSSLQIKEEHGGFKIVGVVSFGLGCGVKGIPSVYTRVSTFIPWINSIVWPTEAEIQNKL